MTIDEKIQSIKNLLISVGFKQLYYGVDEEFTQRIGYGKANYNDFILLEKNLSDSEKLCCRIEMQTLNLGEIINEDKYKDVIMNLHDLNILHIKDEIIDYYFFEQDMTIQNQYDAIMTEFRDKFRRELRKVKIKSLL